MNNHSLNELYDLYKNRVITKIVFESSIYNYCLKNRINTNCCYWNKEEYEDFLSWVFPSIRKIIDKYRSNGQTFESYFNKFLNVSSKEYKVKKITVDVNEYTALCACLPDLYAHEDEPEYLEEHNERIIAKLLNNAESKKNTRRILALILKCYCYVSDDFIEKAASEINMEKEELKNMVEKIRVLRQKKDDKLYLMKEKLYCLHYKCIAFEKKLSIIKDHTTEYMKLKRKLEFTRNQYKKLQIKLKKTKKDATNSQIAEVIGISKGCVDSSLFKLKAKFDLN